MQVKKQHLEWYIEQQIGSKLGKEYLVCNCHPAYVTYEQSTSFEMPGWMKHKLESKLPEEISIISDMHPYGRKQGRTKEPLDESKRGE